MNMLLWSSTRIFSVEVKKPRPMKIIPVTLRQAQAFIDLHHRHNKPPRGHKFSIGVTNGRGILVGVATAGRPIAREFDDGLTLEVNRTCTNGTPNTNSMLYGAIWRAAKAMGFRQCITYTQADESGASLRGAGWVKDKELALRKSWRESSSGRLATMRDTIGNGNVPRIRWKICATKI